MRLAYFSQSWVFYSHRAFIDKAFDVEPLRPLTSLVIEALEHEDMYAVTVEFLTDVLNHFSAFLTSDNISSLSSIMTSTQAQTFISRLKSGDFDTDTTSFARLLLAFGDVNIESLAKVEHPLFDKIGHELLDLLSCEGYAGVEDQICSEALEFWMTYTEYLIDAIFAAGEETPNWMGNARLRVETVIEACWVKIRMPANEIATDWDSDDRAGFKSFREDVQDLLQCAHTLLGVEIFGKLAQLALQSLNGRAWLHLEATLFCLNALSDSISDEASVDQILSRVFGSTLFGDMARIDETVPAKTRHTAVSMITRYTTFFERHVDHLPPMLNFLFESLKAPALANVAAKAIFSSCSSCRKILIPELGAFLQQYEVLLTWATADTYTKEKVMGAIAAIIQAIPTDEEKYAPLSVLIRFVERDANDCIRSTKSSQAEETQASGVCALRCLVSIGKALQAPDDAVIDLDAETPQSMYWIEGQGASLQAKIIQMLETITGLMRWDSDVVEAGCQVLRTGYKESTPGLFVLPPKVSVNFVLSSKLDTARLDYVLDTAGAMISRHATESEDTMKNVASSFIGHLLVIVEMLGREGI